MSYLDNKASMGLTLQPTKTAGNEWFVDSVGGSSSNDGRSWGTAKATYAQAEALAAAGDIIYIADNHAEAIASAGAITVGLAGLTIICLGNGTAKPTFTLGTATTATFKINAANVTLRNARFVCNIDSLVKFIDVNANGFTIEDCDFVTSSTKEALSFINIATTKDYLTIRRCTAEQPTDPAGTDGGVDTGFLYCVDSEYITVEDCHFNGNFETAIFHNKTTKCRYLWVKNCYGIQALSGAEPFQLVADVDGGVFGGMFITPAEAAATEATLVGTIGDKFFVSPTTGFGNDGAAGGQGGIIVATAS